MMARIFRCSSGPKDVDPRTPALWMTLLVAFVLLGVWTGRPASADEATRLSNLLLLEQLVDVDTTQTITHRMVCRSVPIVDGSGRPVGVTQPCLHGIEADPLARPFVVTPTSNVLAALAVNGLVRLAFHGRSKRLLRLGVGVYPVVVLANVETGYAIAHFAPTAPTLRIRALR
jgi:hypothetical protein